MILNALSQGIKYRVHPHLSETSIPTYTQCAHTAVKLKNETENMEESAIELKQVRDIKRVYSM